MATQCSYSVSTENGQYIFVMFATEKGNDCYSQGTEHKKEAQKLRDKYKLSGLYKLDDSSKPIWTVDWYSYKVFISLDGKYLVRTGPWATKVTDEAFSFFDEGELIKTYKINDIIRYVSALPHSVSHFQWEKELKLDNSNNSFQVTTLDGGKFSFDTKSGNILDQSKPVIPNAEILIEPRFYFSNALIIVFVAITALFSIFMIYRKLKHK